MINHESFLKEYNNNNHVMIDIETFSTTTHPIMPQIAAVQFNPLTGEVFRKFDMKISIQSMIDAGFEVSESTLKFWFTQSPAAQKQVLLSEDWMTFDIAIVLEKFMQFIASCSSSKNYVDTRVWGNGPSFDLSKIAASLERLGIKKSWQYNNERCVRTIVAFDGSFKKDMRFIGTAHDGIDDSCHQVRFLSMTLRNIAESMSVPGFSPITESQIANYEEHLPARETTGTKLLGHQPSTS